MLEEEYASADSIPAGWAHLYKETDEKFVLIKAAEVKTVQDVANVQEGLRKEREDHKETKGKLAKFAGKDPDEVLAELDKIEEYKLAAEGTMDETKIESIVASRITAKTAPLERQITSLTTEKGELEGQIATFENQNTQRKVSDHIREAATDAKMLPAAMDDALLMGSSVMTVDDAGNVVTKDNVGVTPGVDASVWLSEVKPNKGHWWPESEGVGAKGGKGGGMGNNPFSVEHWNRTDQGNLYRDNPERATQMAKAAGTTVGGAKPTK